MHTLQNSFQSHRLAKLIACAAGLVVIIVGVIWLTSHASTSFMATEAESGVATANAKVFGDSSASGGKGILFNKDDTTTPPPSGTGLLVGGRVNLPGTGSESAEFAEGEQMFGTLQVTRDYIPGTVPSKYVSPYPAHTSVVLSLKTTSGSLDTFLKSLPANVKYIVWQHEPERPGLFSSGADFVKQFNTARAQIKAIRPDLLVGIASSGFNYRDGKDGADGSYLSPQADWYSIDAYRAGTDDNVRTNAVVPIAQRYEIMRWYNFVKDRGKPLGITEVGNGRADEAGLVANIVQERINTTKTDVLWARDHGFFCYSYFLSGEGPDGHNWLPSDAGFKTMYRALPRG